MPSFQYGNTVIDYTLEHRESTKDISISVEWMEGINVIAPKGLAEKQLEEILYRKAPWILEKWFNIEEIAELPAPKEYVSGEKFPYLGRYYRLKVSKNEETCSPTLTYQKGRFIASIPVNYPNKEKNEILYTLFKQWYIQHGEIKLKERLNLYCPKMGVTPSKLILKDQKMRWGTCTSEGAIYLNWRIIMAPMNVVDYVLVHELAHIRHPNHSSDFWQLVRSVLPDYELRKEWLRINGPLLTLSK